jgi:hypothetical protein
MATVRTACALALGLGLLATGAAARAQGVDTPNETTPPAPTVQTTPEPQREVLVPTRSAREAQRRNRFRVGPELSLFLPSSGKTGDTFGNSWFGIGLGFGSIRRTNQRGELGAEVYLLNHSHDYADAWVIPVGMAYRHPLGSGLRGGPYAGGAVDLLITDLHAPDQGVDWKVRFGAGISPLIGTPFGNSGYLEARYLLTTKVAGFDLSGLSLTAGARF